MPFSGVQGLAVCILLLNIMHARAGFIFHAGIVVLHRATCVYTALCVGSDSLAELGLFVRVIPVKCR